MNLLQRVRFLMRITRTHGIVRRYFVVNGFDGALTMLGLIADPAHRATLCREGRATVEARFSLDRYDLMRALQKDAQPKSSHVVPINEAPVMPPQRAPAAAPATTPAPESPPAPLFQIPLAN